MSLKLSNYLTDSMISCCTYPSMSAHEGGVTAQATSDQLLLSLDRIFTRIKRKFADSGESGCTE